VWNKIHTVKKYRNKEEKEYIENYPTTVLIQFQVQLIAVQRVGFRSCMTSQWLQSGGGGGLREIKSEKHNQLKIV
jgi:hypothetical protein